jgi:hypothetical protein
MSHKNGRPFAHDDTKASAGDAHDVRQRSLVPDAVYKTTYVIFANRCCTMARKLVRLRITISHCRMFEISAVGD